MNAIPVRPLGARGDQDVHPQCLGHLDDFPPNMAKANHPERFAVQLHVRHKQVITEVPVVTARQHPQLHLHGTSQVQHQHDGRVRNPLRAVGGDVG